MEICPADLMRVLENCSSKLLLVDCRPFPMYNKDHIRGSVNAFCPPIFKRRVASRGFIRLESVVSPDVRNRLRGGEFTTLVLYDEAGECKDSSNMHLILQGINKHNYSIKTTCILKGNYYENSTTTSNNNIFIIKCNYNSTNVLDNDIINSLIRCVICSSVGDHSFVRYFNQPL